MAKSKKSPQAVKSPYELTIQLGDVTLHGHGDSVLDAIKSIEKPTKITTKGLLEVTFGDKKTERTLMPVQVKRLWYPLAQRLMAKNIEFLLK